MRAGICVLTNGKDVRLMVCLFIAGLVAALSLASCEAKTAIVTITAEEFRFSPIRLEIPAYQIVRLVVRNQGRERHVFQSRILTHQSVRLLEDSVERQWQGGDVILLKPGQRVEWSMELAPGSYPFRCWLRGHSGMEGVLLVRG